LTSPEKTVTMNTEIKKRSSFEFVEVHQTLFTNSGRK
jgi:hypothetical protein